MEADGIGALIDHYKDERAKFLQDPLVDVEKVKRAYADCKDDPDKLPRFIWELRRDRNELDQTLKLIMDARTEAEAILGDLCSNCQSRQLEQADETDCRVGHSDRADLFRVTIDWLLKVEQLARDRLDMITACELGENTKVQSGKSKPLDGAKSLNTDNWLI